jgi:small subunit ribosomal protein S20
LANIKSAMKKNRQRIKREARNRSQKSEMRSAVKKVRAAITAKNASAAKSLLGPAVRLLDRAGRKGLIEPSAASRVVSRLTIAVNGLTA